MSDKDNDLIRRGEAVEMLLAMSGPVDVPRTEKAVWLDEGIDRCIEELRALPAALIPQPAPDEWRDVLQETDSGEKTLIDWYTGGGDPDGEFARIGLRREMPDGSVVYRTYVATGPWGDPAPMPQPAPDAAPLSPTAVDASPAPDTDAKVAALVEAAKALRAYMLERAELKIDQIRGAQYRIVNAGNTAWSDFCAALAALEGRGNE
jgi:hypothetical protein